MQIVLLRVVVRRGVRRVRVVAGRGAGLALDVEQRRVGQEGRARQAQRVLRVLRARRVPVVLGWRVSVCVCVSVSVSVSVRGRVRCHVCLTALGRALTRH